MVSASRDARYWSAYVASGLGIAVALLLVAHERPEPSPCHPGETKNAYHGAAQSAPASNGAQAVAKPDEQAGREDCGAPKKAADHAGDSQLRWTDDLVALSALASAIFAGALVFLTHRLFVVGKDQHQAAVEALNETRRAAQAAEDAVEAARASLDRPWLYVDADKPIAIPRPGQKEIRYTKVTITNYGGAPAVIMKAEGVFFFNPGAYREKAFEQRFGKLREFMRKFPEASELSSFINKAGKQPEQIRTYTFDSIPIFEPVPHGNGIVVKPDSSHTFYFRADSEIDGPRDDGMSLEQIAYMYLIGRITYTSPNEDIECLVFTFEAKALGQFASVGGKPYNDRRRWKPKEIWPDQQD